ncbi:MAG: insulinase family protein [Chitinophagaceae bacterium]|jgi:predicted Zn-dependent peptidase|nr:insulinase family protein [Chitinophagaceae bacterium]
MKKYISGFCFLAACLLCTVGLKAQKKEPYEMTVEGVKVIVQPSGNEIVEIQAVFRGGVQNYPENKAGIEKMAFQALTECGTTNDDKNSFKNKLDKVSAQVYGSSGMDLSKLNMNCIRSDFDAVWPLYADALTGPRFDEKEFERIRQDAINEIKANESQPDYAIGKYARKLAFNGKNYAKDPEGTEATIKQLTVPETKKHYESILTRSRIFFVVVGEFDRADLEKRMAEVIRRIPAGAPIKFVKESYKPGKNTFSSTQKEFATNYIQGITGAPQPGDPDFNAFNLAMRMFADKYFIEVRTKNGLSYAPQAWFDGSMTPTANIAVSTTDPDKYIAVTKALVDKLKKEGFSAEEVKNEKTGYVTGIYYRNEMNSSQASSLASNEALFGNWKRAITLKDEINQVKVEDVNKAFNKYFSNITWAYMGNPAKVTPKLFTEPGGKAAPASTLKKGKKG